LIILPIGLAIVIFGLVAIVKEKEKLIIVLTVLSALGDINYLHDGQFGLFVSGLLTTILHGFYAKMCFDKKQDLKETTETLPETNPYNYQKVYNNV
jgi:hypothetical protein